MKKKIFTTIIIAFLMIFVLIGCISTGEQHIEITEGGYGFEVATNKVIRACVIIDAYFENMKSSGAGVVISQDGHIITNRHVVNSNNHFSTNIKVKVLSENKKNYDTYNAKVLTTNQHNSTDLAVLKIDALINKFEYAIFGDSESLNFGESCFIVGFPKSLALSVSPALISNPSVIAKHQDYSETEYVLISAPVNSGNSGGGLFNLQGELMGIVTLRYQDSTDNNENVVLDLGYAQTANDVVKFIKNHPELKDFV